MDEVTISRYELKLLNPCENRSHGKWRLFNGGKRVSAADALAAGATLQDLLWVALGLAERLGDNDVERRLRLWGADCAARAIPEFQQKGRKEAVDAIVVARAFIRGDVSELIRSNAEKAVAEECQNVSPSFLFVSAANWAVRAAARHRTFSVCFAANAATKSRVIELRQAEEKWQTERLVAWLSADEPEDWPIARME